MRSRVVLVVACVLTALVAHSPNRADAAPATNPGLVVGAWGRNNEGQIGDASTTDRLTAAQSAVGEAIAVAAGFRYSLALKADGTVWAWGQNANGQLGDGTTTTRSTPVQTSGLSHVVAIAAGGAHALALKDDGTVWAWGWNVSGELGDGTLTSRPTPAPVSGLTNVTGIAAGNSHSLAVLSDGTVRAWGYNGNGELGLNTISGGSSVPVQVTGLTQVAAVSGGTFHSLAVKVDGTVWAWGDNAYGQLGDNTTISRLAPVQVVALAGVTTVAAGSQYSLARKSDGTVHAWGLGTTGQLGTGAATNRSTATQVSGLAGATAIAAGGGHALARKADGTVVAWGLNTYGQIGNNDQQNRLLPTAVSGLSGATTIAAGVDHSIALAVPGLLRVVTSPAVPSQITLDGVVADSYGLAYVKVFPGTHTVRFAHVEGFTEPGSLTGSVVSGATTTVTGTFVPRGFLRVTTSPATPGTIYVDGTPREDWGMWTDIPTGSHSVCFGTVVGSVTPACQTVTVTAGATTEVTGVYGGSATKEPLVPGAWGRNTLRQLGDGTTADRLVPVSPGVGEATAVAGGQSFSLMLRADRTVSASGENTNGQLGDGTTLTRTNPVLVAGLGHVTAIAAGVNGNHGLALKSDGRVWAWGNNDNGQLGDGTTTQRLTPVAVSGLTDVASIAAGNSHSLAVKKDGTVWSWGSNLNGELGDGSNTDHHTPTQVANLVGIESVTAGPSFSLARNSAGTVWAWGKNDFGQLGDGTTTPRNTPLEVVDLDPVAAIAAGVNHVLAAMTDGTVRAWGRNFEGELGDGTATSDGKIVESEGLTDVIAVAAGVHSLALKADGTVWAWGWNGYGQVGAGNPPDNQLTPIAVPGLTGVRSIGAGTWHSMVVAVPGLLRVVSSPGVPSQITLDGSAADTYGLAYVKVLPGAHTVSFGRVEGFSEPASMTTPFVVSGLTTTVTGTFIPRGYLRVLTEPASPATIYVDGTPREDWGMWTDIPTGPLTVCFGTVVGLTTPPCQATTVTAGMTTTITGVF